MQFVQFRRKTQNIVKILALMVTGVCVVCPRPALAQSDDKEIKVSMLQVQRGARMALLIANQAYTELGTLSYTKNDAKLMETLLKEAGFQVTIVTDANQEKMDNAIATFAEQVKAKRAEVALFLYSGHGTQFRGQNYLIPLEAQIRLASDIKTRTISAEETLERLDDTDCPLIIMILDACRNVKFKNLVASKGEEGLARVQPVQGRIVVYATAPGTIAKDNAFTPVFVREIRANRNANFAEVFDATTEAVENETMGQQVPWCAMSKGGNFRFFPPATVKPVLLPNTAAYRQQPDYRTAEAAFKAGQRVKVVPLLRPFAEAGDGRAQAMLGDCLDNNKKTYSEAFAWYTKSAQKGDPFGQSKLGWCYDMAIGVSENNEQAKFWYEKSLTIEAEQEDWLMQYQLGYCYINGFGVLKDEKKAMDWFRKSAEQENLIAQNSLASCYKEGRGVSKDLIQVTQWYRRSAQQGEAVAQYSLGTMYYKGEGVKQDFNQAFDWFHKSAMQEDPTAQNWLGGLYYRGEGVKQDYKQAVEWYRESAGQGNTASCYKLGYCYENGKGISKDIEEALRWYKKAAASGNEDAKKALKRLGRE